MRCFVVVFSAFFLFGCSPSLREQNSNDLQSLSTSHFRDTATVKNGNLDTVVTVSTEPGYQRKEGLFGITWSDSFVRIFQDKATKKKTYQIYSYVNYQSSDWRFYESVNFETATGPGDAPLRVIDRNVDCTQYGCTYSEHVAFEVSESLAKFIAGKAGNSNLEASSWAYRLNAKRGEDFDRRLLGAEMDGAMQRMAATP